MHYVMPHMDTSIFFKSFNLTGGRSCSKLPHSILLNKLTASVLFIYKVQLLYMVDNHEQDNKRLTPTEIIKQHNLTIVK